MKSFAPSSPIPTPLSPTSITPPVAKESLDKLLPWIYETSWQKQIPHFSLLYVATSEADATASLPEDPDQDLLDARIEFQHLHIQEPHTTHRLAALLSKYHECVKDTMELQMTIKKLQSQAQDRAKRLWVVENKSRVLQAKCGDGVEITHTFHYNEGHFQAAEGAKLSKLLFKLRSEADTLLYRKLYESKMARIQIQEYLDRVCWESQGLRSVHGGERLTLSDDASELSNFQALFDILFHYERFFAHLQYAESNIGENYIATSHTVSAALITILDDIRGWISQLFVPYTSCCNFRDRRFLFHHLISCPGIEKWGKNLTNYLLVSEQSQQGEIEITAMVQILAIASNLNGVPKNVLEQSGLSSTNKTLLTEEDISSVLDQLSIPERLNAAVTGALFKVKASSQPSDDQQDVLLYPLSLANDYFQCLSQLLLQFSKTSHTVIMKRLAQMLCQLLQNVGRLAKGHNDLNITSEIEDKMQQRVDKLATDVFHCYLELPRKGVQHFLASIPVQFVSVDGLWSIINDIFQVTPNSNVKYPAKAYSIDRFCKFLLDNNEEGIFYLQCLSNISLVIDSQRTVSQDQTDFTTAQNVILAIAYVFFHVAYLNEELREMYYKDVRDTYKVMCDRHPLLISNLLHWTVNDFDKIGNIALYLFHSLSLADWNVRQDDLGALQQLTCSGTLSDLGINFTKYILENLNYGYTTEVESEPHSRTKPWEKRHRPHLSYAIHSEIAFMILGIAQRIQPTTEMFEKAAPSTEALTSTIAPYIPSSSGVFLSSTDVNKRKFMDWCWDIVLRLQLFECPVNSRAADLDDAITNIGIGDHAKLSNDLTANHLCLVIYIAFMLSPTSRHFLRFDISRGWEKVQLMLRSNHVDSLLYMLANVVPGFVYMHGDDFFNHGSTVWLLDHILNAKSDPCLAEAGKLYLINKDGPLDLIKPENGLEVVIGSQAWLAKEIDKAFSLEQQNGGFSYLDLLLHSWIKIICVQPDWMWKPNRIALVDYCAKIAFTNRRYTLVPSLLQLEAQRLDDVRQSTASPASSSKSGHEGSRNPMRFMKSVLADTAYPSLLTGEWSMVSLASSSLFKTPNVENHSFYFAFQVLVLETIADADFRMQIGRQLQKDGSKDDADISAVVKHANINLRKPVDFISIYRWAQHILVVPADHNLLPLFLQMFFSLYFSRLTNDELKTEFFYGHLFFSKKDSLLESLKKRLVQLKEFHINASKAAKEKGSNEKNRFGQQQDLKHLYHAMLVWLGDARLQKDMQDISDLPSAYQPARLLQCRKLGGSLSSESVKDLDVYDESNLWMDLVNTTQMTKEFDQFQWVSKVVPYQAPESTSRPNSSMAIRTHTPSPNIPLLMTKLPDFKLRKPATSLSLDEILQMTPQDLFGNTVRSFYHQARQFSQLTTEHQALDSGYLKQLERLYYNKTTNSTIQIPCKRVPQGICQKPARFHLEQLELKVEENTEQQLSENRAAVSKLAYDKIDSRICVQSFQALAVMEDMTRRYDNQLSPLQSKKACESVYFVFEALRDNASEFPPAKLLSRQIAQMASESFAMHPDQLDPLLRMMGSDDRYINLLFPAFEPQSDPARFVDIYEKTCLSDKYSASSQLKLSTKFDVLKWFSTSQGSSKEQRIKWYETAFKAIQKIGRTTNEKPLERSLSYRHSSLAMKLLSAAHQKFNDDMEYIQVLMLIVDTYVNKPMNTYHLRAYMDFLGVPLDAIRRAITSGQHQSQRLKALNQQQLHTLLDTIIKVWKSAGANALEYVYNSCGSMYELVFACLCDDRIMSEPLGNDNALQLIFKVHEPLLTSKNSNRPKEFDQISEGLATLLMTLIATHRSKDITAAILEQVLIIYHSILPSVRQDWIKILNKDLFQLPWNQLRPNAVSLDLILHTITQLIQDDQHLQPQPIYIIYLEYITSLLVEWIDHFHSETNPNIIHLYIRLAFYIVQYIDDIDLDTQATLTNFTQALENCISTAKVNHALMHAVCSSLRKTWPTPLDTFQPTLEVLKENSNSNPLLVCLIWLRMLAGIHSNSNKQGEPSMVQEYVAYTLSLALTYVETPGTNFSRTGFSELIVNTLLDIDNSFYQPNRKIKHPDITPDVRKLLGDIVSLPNRCPEDSAIGNDIWKSILGNMQLFRNIFTELFHVGCRLISHVKPRVVLLEACIEQELNASSSPVDDTWRQFGQSLELPLSDTDGFLHQCLENCCIMTLHVRCVSELLECHDYANECKVAEELAAFLSITVIPPDSIRQSTKLLLLLHKFSTIFSRAEGDFSLEKCQLLPALVSIHRTLFQWAEGKDSHRIAQIGLLGNLGEMWTGGQAPAISVEWKLYSRLVCGFIGKHLAQINISQIGPQSKTMSVETWQEWTLATSNMKEYAKYSSFIPECIEIVQQASISQMDQVVGRIAKILFQNVNGVEL
ncbi:hypothetical protein INT44_007524 [Umbelopsis vinacea]|uniref:Epg5-like TPR domain-containing protein n=1 Tax=Umbelopsis vinacea TaxID=44442 RepID=A0A8H7PN81_9FUNG|nr:hypothetical protein INT44_007524 [Umbelopsis vinacea]